MCAARGGIPKICIFTDKALRNKANQKQLRHDRHTIQLRTTL